MDGTKANINSKDNHNSQAHSTTLLAREAKDRTC